MILAEERKEERKLTSEQSTKIQILRGLAIIAVVFIHNTPVGLTQIWCRPFMNFSVGLFLFLSGLLSDAKHWNPVKRIIKMAIPYFIWTLVYVAIANITGPSNIPIAYIKALITANSAAVMYYIFVYCQFTLLIPLIDKLARSNFYIGYLIGNRLLKVNISTIKLTLIWTVSIALQIGEGYLQFSAGELNCGTQLKLTSILSGTLFSLLAYKYIMTDKCPYKFKTLKILGDNSFGIYFSHLAVMTVLAHLPYYPQYIVFPFNAVIAVFITLMCVEIGKKILGKYAKYLAL